MSRHDQPVRDRCPPQHSRGLAGKDEPCPRRVVCDPAPVPQFAGEAVYSRLLAAAFHPKAGAGRYCARYTRQHVTAALHHRWRVWRGGKENCSWLLFVCRMILSKKSATFWDHALTAAEELISQQRPAPLVFTRAGMPPRRHRDRRRSMPATKTRRSASPRTGGTKNIPARKDIRRHRRKRRPAVVRA